MAANKSILIFLIFLSSNLFAQAGSLNLLKTGGTLKVYNIEDIQKITFEGVSEVSPRSVSPQEFILYQNYPNPFNPVTKIRYYIAKESNVRLTIFDTLGQELITISEGIKTAGTYETIFDASHFTSGIYFYRLTTDDFSEIKKLVLCR
ncbi:MAG: T9SS type A sorting domain-containing protein [Bacteroidota bacterium]|nr:T9SS type A sorting domain-containing protein [Bacteroidota bacterium]MDP4193528.1 T9SS type A sorting domain-containing protein [Bacteroidota bacterium]